MLGGVADENVPEANRRSSPAYFDEDGHRLFGDYSSFALASNEMTVSDPLCTASSPSGSGAASGR